MPDASSSRLSTTPCKSPSSPKFPVVQIDHGRPPSPNFLTQCSCWFYASTCPDWFCSKSRAEIPVKLWKVKSGLLTFARCHHFVLWICWGYSRQVCSERRWTVPKIMQTGSGIVKTWAVTHTGRIYWHCFFGPPCTFEIKDKNVHITVKKILNF